MKNKIAILICGALLTGCLQEYPEQQNSGDNDKACNLAKYVSNISFQHNTHSTLPAKLSGAVNGVATINECTLGNTNEVYTLVRNGDRSVTIVLWVDKSAVLRETYFNDDGTPKDNARIQLSLSGRGNCSDTPSQVKQTTRVVNWQPVYSNSNKACGPSGYSAIISN